MECGWCLVPVPLCPLLGVCDGFDFDASLQTDAAVRAGAQGARAVTLGSARVSGPVSVPGMASRILDDEQK